MVAIQFSVQELLVRLCLYNLALKLLSFFKILRRHSNFEDESNMFLRNFSNQPSDAVSHASNKNLRLHRCVYLKRQNVYYERKLVLKWNS